MKKKRRESVTSQMGFDVVRATIEELHKIKVLLREKPNNNHKELMDLLLETAEAEADADGDSFEDSTRLEDVEDSDGELPASEAPTSQTLEESDLGDDKSLASEAAGLASAPLFEEAGVANDKDLHEYRACLKLLYAPQLPAGFINPDLCGWESHFRRTFENFDSRGHGELTKQDFQDFVLAYCACAVYPDWKEQLALEKAAKFTQVPGHNERIDAIWKLVCRESSKLTFAEIWEYFNRAPMQKKDIEALRACVSYWQDRRPTRGENAILTSRFMSQDELKERDHKQAKAEKDRVTRQLTCAEVLTSERKFVKKLQVMMDLFFKPMAEKKMRSRFVIFGNLPTLLKLNTKFLADVQTKMSNWSADRTTLGDVFADYAPFFRIYALYACNLPLATKFLASADEWSWTSLKASAEKQPRMKGALSSYLIEPVQRLPRYKLFLDSLQKLTDPYHPDSVLLPRALRLMVDTATHVNETVRLQEQKMEVWNLERRFAVPPYLQSPTRNFIRQAKLNKKYGKLEATYLCMLFTNILAIAEEKTSADGKGPDLMLRAKIPIDSAMTIQEVSDTTFRISHVKETAILLRRQGNHHSPHEMELVRAPTAVSFHKVENKSTPFCSPLRSYDSSPAFHHSLANVGGASSSRPIPHAESFSANNSSSNSCSNNHNGCSGGCGGGGSNSFSCSGTRSGSIGERSLVGGNEPFKCTRPHLSPTPVFSFELRCESRAERDVWVADLKKCLLANQAAVPNYCCDKYDIRSDYYDIGDDTNVEAMTPDNKEKRRWLPGLSTRGVMAQPARGNTGLPMARREKKRGSWTESSDNKPSSGRHMERNNSVPNGNSASFDSLQFEHSDLGTRDPADSLLSPSQLRPADLSACEFCTATMQIDSGKAVCHCETCVLDMCYACRVANNVEGPPFLKISQKSQSRSTLHDPQSPSDSSSPRRSVIVDAGSGSTPTMISPPSLERKRLTFQKCLRKLARLFPTSNQYGVKISDAPLALDLQNATFPLRGIGEAWLFRVNDYLRTQVKKSADPIATRVLAALHASLCCLKNIYLMDVFSWSSVRARLPVEVGLIKATSDCGNSSVSMGLASIYFREVSTHDNQAVAFLACSSFGVRFQLYLKTGGIVSCLLEYHPPTTVGTVATTSHLRVGRFQPDVVHTVESVMAEIKMGMTSAPWMRPDVRERLTAMFSLKSPNDLRIPVFGYVTGKIRNYWELCEDLEEKVLIESTIARVLEGVSEYSFILGSSGFLMSVKTEGQMDLEATRALYRQYSAMVGKRLEPVISLSVGSDSCQWTTITSSAPDDYRRYQVDPAMRIGMNGTDLPQLSTLVLAHWTDRGELLANLMKDAIDRGNTPVIALKAGALGSLEDKDNGKKWRKELCDLANVLPSKHESRVMVSIRRKSSSSRQEWPLWTTSLSVACGEVSKVLALPEEKIRPDFLRVQIENAPTFLKDLNGVTDGTALVFWTAYDLLAELLGPTRRRVIAWIREVDVRQGTPRGLPTPDATAATAAAAAAVVNEQHLTWLPSMTGTWPTETRTFSPALLAKTPRARKSPLRKGISPIGSPQLLCATSPFESSELPAPLTASVASAVTSAVTSAATSAASSAAASPIPARDMPRQSLSVAVENDPVATPRRSPGAVKPKLSLESLCESSPPQIKVLPPNVANMPELPSAALRLPDASPKPTTEERKKRTGRRSDQLIDLFPEVVYVRLFPDRNPGASTPSTSSLAPTPMRVIVPSSSGPAPLPTPSANALPTPSASPHPTPSRGPLATPHFASTPSSHRPWPTMSPAFTSMNHLPPPRMSEVQHATPKSRNLPLPVNSPQARAQAEFRQRKQQQEQASQACSQASHASSHASQAVPTPPARPARQTAFTFIPPPQAPPPIPPKRKKLVTPAPAETPAVVATNKPEPSQSPAQATEKQGEEHSGARRSSDNLSESAVIHILPESTSPQFPSTDGNIEEAVHEVAVSNVPNAPSSPPMSDVTIQAAPENKDTQLILSAAPPSSLPDEKDSLANSEVPSSDLTAVASSSVSSTPVQQPSHQITLSQPPPQELDATSIVPIFTAPVSTTVLAKLSRGTPKLMARQLQPASTETPTKTLSATPSTTFGDILTSPEGQLIGDSPSTAGLFSQAGYLHFPKQFGTPQEVHSPVASPKVQLLTFTTQDDAPVVTVQESSVKSPQIPGTPSLSDKSDSSIPGDRGSKVTKSPGVSLRDRSSSRAGRIESPEHSIFNLLRTLSNDSIRSQSPTPDPLNPSATRGEGSGAVSGTESVGSCSGRVRSSSQNCGSIRGSSASLNQSRGVEGPMEIGRVRASSASSCTGNLTRRGNGRGSCCGSSSGRVGSCSSESSCGSNGGSLVDHGASSSGRSSSGSRSSSRGSGRGGGCGTSGDSSISGSSSSSDGSNHSSSRSNSRSSGSSRNISDGSGSGGSSDSSDSSSSSSSGSSSSSSGDGSGSTGSSSGSSGSGSSGSSCESGSGSSNSSRSSSRSHRSRSSSASGSSSRTSTSRSGSVSHSGRSSSVGSSEHVSESKNDADSGGSGNNGSSDIGSSSSASAGVGSGGEGNNNNDTKGGGERSAAADSNSGGESGDDEALEPSMPFPSRSPDSPNIENGPPPVADSAKSPEHEEEEAPAEESHVHGSGSSGPIPKQRMSSALRAGLPSPKRRPPPPPALRVSPSCTSPTDVIVVNPLSSVRPLRLARQIVEAPQIPPDN